MTASVAQYFRQHPEAKDGVVKAHYAYHALRSEDIRSHEFASVLRGAPCLGCGRTRERVRWDDLPAHCLRPLPSLNAEGIIRGEELKALALLEKAEKTVPKIVAKLGMSGETLAVLYHTYGYDPETVAGVVAVPESLIADYNLAMERERERSRDSQVKKLVLVQEKL